MAEDYAATATPKPVAPKPPAASGAPDDELKKLKEAQAKDQAEFDKLKKKMDESQSRIKELEKSVADAGQVTSAYTSTLQSIATDRLQTQDFLANDLPQLEKNEEVKSKAAEVAAKIKEVNAAIETKESEQQILAQKLKDERAALQTANDDLAVKKLALDGVKDQQKVIQERFAKIKKLRQRIDSEGANKPLLKYVLALELKSVWEGTKDLLITKEALEASYYAKADEHQSAATTASGQEDKVKMMQGELEASRKDLDARKTSRLDDIIKKVGELGGSAPVAMAAAASGAATRTATA
jgi:DNA repair exonuclease SbcCD ATPase subunit